MKPSSISRHALLRMLNARDKKIEKLRRENAMLKEHVKELRTTGGELMRKIMAGGV